MDTKKLCLNRYKKIKDEKPFWTLNLNKIVEISKYQPWYSRSGKFYMQIIDNTGTRHVFNSDNIKEIETWE